MRKIIKNIVSCVLTAAIIATGFGAASIAAPATPEDAGNLIKASNFYKGQTAWRISPNSKVGETVYTEGYLEEEVPEIGKTHVLTVTQRANDTNTNSAVVQQFVSLTKGNTYQLSYWLKVEGTDSNSKFAVYYNPQGAGAKRTIIEDGITTTDGEWKKFEYTFNVDYDTVAAEEYIRFEMSEVAGTSDVVYKITDVRLEQTVTNYVPGAKSGRWSSYANGSNTVSIADKEIKVVTIGDTNNGNPNISFTHDMQTGTTYNISFHLEIDGDVSNTSQTHTGFNFSMYEITASPNGFQGIASTTEQQDFVYEYTMGTVASGKTPTMRMYFARPATAGQTITYTLTNLTITKKGDIAEETTGIKELVSEADRTFTATTTSTNTTSMGLKAIAHDKSITEYTISFHLKIEGTSSGINKNEWFGKGRALLMQQGFAGINVLEVFDADANGNDFIFKYKPTSVKEGATTFEFRLYFDIPSEGELKYTVSDLSITYREGTAIKEIAVTGADITSGNPGQVSDYSWGTNEAAEAYTLTQRWERMNYGTFATTDSEINEAFAGGIFMEFVSGNDYRYSLVVTPKDGYYLADDLSLKLNGETVAADYYYCADGSVIICPADNEIFFTVMGDANKDGSADVRDLVRMKRYVSDNTIEVYAKKCNFDTTTDDITTEDVTLFREYLVEK